MVNDPDVAKKLDQLCVNEARQHAINYICSRRGESAFEAAQLLNTTERYEYRGSRKRSLPRVPASLMFDLLILRAAGVEPADYPDAVRQRWRKKARAIERQVDVRIRAWDAEKETRTAPKTSKGRSGGGK